MGVPTSPSPCPVPPDPFWPWRKWGISMFGTGMLTNSRPLRPIISPLLMYFRSCCRTLPRTICLKRERSRSMLRAIGHLVKDCSVFSVQLPNTAPFLFLRSAFFILHSFPVFRVSTGEDAGHILQHVCGRFLV